MYLATYKARFILHLVRLEKKDLLTKFQIAFRYIDGLCLINVQNPRDFLSPKQPHIEDNPFQIYPLNVLKIEEETVAFNPVNKLWGLQAYFMNINIIVHQIAPMLYMFRKFDKQRTLPFWYMQYIKF